MQKKKTYSLPTTRIVHFGNEDTKVCSNCYHLLAARLVEGSRTIDFRPTYWTWPAGVCVHLFDVSDGPIEWRPFDGYALLSANTAFVCKGRVCHDAKLEWFGILRKQSSGMLCPRLDDLVAPIFAVLQSRSKQRVRLLPEMLHSDRIQSLVILGYFNGRYGRSLGLSGSDAVRGCSGQT